MQAPILYIVIPCYNEESVLPVSSVMFEEERQKLVDNKKISPDSKILFVDDGSTDRTWVIIKELHEQNKHFIGIKQSRNRGHQNSLLAGLMEAKGKCDITISIDCDGQDDISVMEDMVDEYIKGSDVVYGVRSKREKDTLFKRVTAQGYYRILQAMGADVVYNHADYRLVSSKVLEAFSEFKEVNLFLRGLIPLVGFKSSCVYYERHDRISGKSHYPLKKMLALACDGITSLSIKPLRIITLIGMIVSIVSFVGVIWAVTVEITGGSVAGWASMVCIFCFFSGIQLISLGVIGEYIGKIYLEVKNRPRYIICDKIGE